jgi:Domain of unknown function (DUF6456)
MSARLRMNAYVGPARMHADEAGVDRLRAQHLELGRRQIHGPSGVTEVTVDEAESPLAWLARRKGRDGRALIDPVQLLAGERLRAEFTRAQLMPRITANWSAPVADGRRGASAGAFTETVVAARQRVRHALEAVGPEFSGLLVDVCCFLKGLAEIERERNWPSRSAKVVLQLGLDRLARHYGLSAEARGRGGAGLRTWLADDAEFIVGAGTDPVAE